MSMPRKAERRARTNKDFFEGERMNSRGETEDRASLLRQKIAALGVQLSKLGVSVGTIEVSHETPMSTLRRIADKRHLMSEAARLGVEFDPNETNSIIHMRIIEHLPGILKEKGLVDGAVIIKNHGGAPEAKHLIIDASLEDDEDNVVLRDLEGDFGTYAYRAINLAAYATVVTPAPLKPES